MTDSGARIRPPWVDTLVFGTATAAMVVAATFVMFSAFMSYDDEGYVLLSLRNYAEHGGLYRDVYSQYGPFPFVFYDGLQALGLPLTHTTGRIIAIGAWTGAAVFCAAIAGQFTGSILVRLAVLAAVFLYLWVMASEPSHPGGLIVFLTTLLAAFGARWIASGKLKQWAVLVGSITAALLLTKVNIGAFVVFSVGAWLLLNHRNEHVRRWAPVVAGVGALILGVALMRPLLMTPWVRTYAFVFACSAIAIVIAIAAGSSGHIGWRTFGLSVIAGFIVLIAVLGAVLLRGTTPNDLLDGIIISPLRQPTVFNLWFFWPPAIWVIAIASLAACAVACLRRRQDSVRVDTCICFLRLLATLAFAVHLIRFPRVSPDYLVFGSALPCLWVFAWPLAAESTTRGAARAWITLLLLGQCLHPFPVPGSQIAWGSVLTIPLAAIGAWDAATWLAGRTLRTGTGMTRASWVAHIVITGLAATVSWKFFVLASRYREGQNLSLPGAESIRLPDKSAALFRMLAQNAIAHGDMLFSLPGMFSFNLWTGLPTPTHANVTHWFSLLDATRQRKIVRELENHPRACIIVHREHVNFLNARMLAPKGVLHEYLSSSFQAAFVLDGFEFWVRRGRQIEPFMLASLFTRATDSQASATESTLIKMSVLVPPQQPVSFVDVRSERPWEKSTRLDSTNTRVEIVRISGSGIPSGNSTPATWPVKLAGPSMLLFYYNPDPGTTPPREATIILRSENGDEIGLGLLRP